MKKNVDVFTLWRIRRIENQQTSRVLYIYGETDEWALLWFLPFVFYCVHQVDAD
jgi:hypothetical protein